MTALLVLLVLAAAVAAGAAARLLQPHTGRHTASYLATHQVTALPPHQIDIGTWI